MGALSLMTVVAAVAISTNPPSALVEERVDLIEVNHFYDDQGRLVLDQVIFYDWVPADARFHVRAWRLLKDPAQIPRRDWRTDSYITVWHDGDVLRRVYAQAVRETWTQYDPELLEREYLPKERRRELERVQAASYRER